MHKVFKPSECPEGYDFEETCPHCDNTIPVVIDNDCFDYHTTCPVCGKTLMLCGLCRMDVTGGYPLTGYHECGQMCYEDLIKRTQEV